MKIVVLIDNSPSADDRLTAEHGLSLYFETGGKKYLLDTGLTGAAMRNALHLGIDLSAIDALFLSHGHIDHTGGLSAFLEENTKAPIYLSQRVAEYIYSSNRRGKEHDLSPDKSLFQTHSSRFTFLTSNLALTEQISLVFCPQHLSACPAGNSFLHIGEKDSQKPYLADDELAVAVKESDGLVILSPCSHNGLQNILTACSSFTKVNNIRAFIGGLHLLDEMTDKDSVPAMAEAIKATYPELQIFTGHCTGPLACSSLQRVLGEQVSVFQTGKTILL